MAMNITRVLPFNAKKKIGIKVIKVVKFVEKAIFVISSCPGRVSLDFLCVRRCSAQKRIASAAEDINFHSIWNSLERDDKADNAWTNEDWSKNEMLAHWRDGDITKSLHTVPQEKAPLVDIKDDPRDQVQSTAIESEMKYDDNEYDDEKEGNADKYEHGYVYGYQNEYGYEDENNSYSHDGYHRH
ncbi:hypothetical protein BDV39DRAFT_206741 [Aspergillus sergii]|uniref:Uncharacterized protein n=1 Tax=Aspergillus sergii TaxID=1034303 RepID=A0A5N6X224_9EURO|nr:hypothetical protein BDV39DRAFT_206741 [Aspergillus sergii]